MLVSPEDWRQVCAGCLAAVRLSPCLFCLLFAVFFWLFGMSFDAHGFCMDRLSTLHVVAHAVKNRMKTVKNIKKITSAMKLVAASKLRKAQTDMEKSRVMVAPFTRIVGDHPDVTGAFNLTVPLTTDRGLCGGINTSVTRYTRAVYKAVGGEDDKFVVFGEKGRAQMARADGKNIAETFGDTNKVRVCSLFCHQRVSPGCC